MKGFLFALAFLPAAQAQVPPSRAEIGKYQGLFAAVLGGSSEEIRKRVAAGEKPDARDGYARTPLHVAAHFQKREAMRALVAAGADPNALERDRYDIVTIAAVANDLPTLEAALELGCSAKNVTRRYDGTRLLAAAALGTTQALR